MKLHFNSHPCIFAKSQSCQQKVFMEKIYSQYLRTFKNSMFNFSAFLKLSKNKMNITILVSLMLLAMQCQGFVETKQFAIFICIKCHKIQIIGNVHGRSQSQEEEEALEEFEVKEGRGRTDTKRRSLSGSYLPWGEELRAANIKHYS